MGLLRETSIYWLYTKHGESLIKFVVIIMVKSKYYTSFRAFHTAKDGELVKSRAGCVGGVTASVHEKNTVSHYCCYR